MRITEVHVKLVRFDHDKLRGFCSITIDDEFVVRDLKIIEGSKGPFVAMPSRKTKTGEYKDIAHPICPEFRQKLQDLIVSSYDRGDNSDEEMPI